MTTQNDFIRQTSLFTISGLVDPRLMPDYKKDSVTKKDDSEEVASSSLFERFVAKMFNRSALR